MAEAVKSLHSGDGFRILEDEENYAVLEIVDEGNIVSRVIESEYDGSVLANKRAWDIYCAMMAELSIKRWHIEAAIRWLLCI